MADLDLRLRRWSRVEYERLVEYGFFQPGDRVELIGGQLLVAEPQNSPHATAVGLVEDALREAFGRGWVVRVQARDTKPVAKLVHISERSRPRRRFDPAAHARWQRKIAGGKVSRWVDRALRAARKDHQ